MSEFRIGDFVLFQYGKNSTFPGQIKDIENDEYVIEICVNRKKSEANEVEIVRGRLEEIQPMSFA